MAGQSHRGGQAEAVVEDLGLSPQQQFPTLDEHIARADGRPRGNFNMENSMTAMRAKLQIASVTNHGTTEQLKFHGVGPKNGYGDDGLDEDNTFAKYSPSVALDIMIANPALLGKFQPGQTFYVDFTPAE